MENAKRIWLITDIHLGAYNNSKLWQDTMQEYFDNFFFPLLDRNKKEGDVLCCLGDVFDNRCNLQLQIQHLGISIFERMSNYFDTIHVIAGNHDVFFKSNNDVCSLDCMKYIPNITIHKTPFRLANIYGDIFLMPWMPSHKEEKELLNGIDGCKYLFCHTDIAGLHFNRHTIVEHGTEATFLKERFKYIMSGHIHYRQEKDGVYMLGSPYPMDRNDAGNDKGIYLLDLENERMHFFKNDISPIFVKYRFEDLSKCKKEEISKLIKNNFVDLLIDADTYNDKDLKKFVSDYGKMCKRLELEYVTKEVLPNHVLTESDKLDVEDMAMEVIGKHDYPKIISKERILDYVKELFKRK